METKEQFAERFNRYFGVELTAEEAQEAYKMAIEAFENAEEMDFEPFYEAIDRVLDKRETAK